jgi:hypothetical protein
MRELHHKSVLIRRPKLRHFRAEQTDATAAPGPQKQSGTIQDMQSVNFEVELILFNDEVLSEASNENWAEQDWFGPDFFAD